MLYEDRRNDQRVVDYRVAADLSQSCAVCEYFVPENACDLVAGVIRVDYVCDLWEQGSPRVPVTGDYVMAKADDEAQIIFGWANVAIRSDGEQIVDSHNDMIDPEDLADAAYEFMLSSRVGGEDHVGLVDAIAVESVAFTKEKVAAMGLPEGIVPEGWWIGFHIPNPEAYARAKTSKQMFSIEGTAEAREQVSNA